MTGEIHPFRPAPPSGRGESKLRLAAVLAADGVGYSRLMGGVYEQIKNKLVCGYQSLGDRKVKNITDPVPIYRVLTDLAAVRKAHRPRGVLAAAAVAVLCGVAAAGWYFWPSHGLQQAAMAPA